MLQDRISGRVQDDTYPGSKPYLLSTEANDLAELLVDTYFKGG